MRKKCFDWESVYAYIWENTDSDGIWTGDETTLARKYGASEDDGYSMLDDLCERRLIEKLPSGKYYLANRERDEPCDAEPYC